jgi:hypothetical protein
MYFIALAEARRTLPKCHSSISAEFSLNAWLQYLSFFSNDGYPFKILQTNSFGFPPLSHQRDLNHCTIKRERPRWSASIFLKCGSRMLGFSLCFVISYHLKCFTRHLMKLMLHDINFSQSCFHLCVEFSSLFMDLLFILLVLRCFIFIDWQGIILVILVIFWNKERKFDRKWQQYP